MGGGGGTPDKTTTTTELPVWAQGAAKNLLSRGEALSNKPLPVYTDPRTAALNSTQLQGMDMTTQRALNGSEDINAGSRTLQSTLNGDYLSGSNPYLSNQIDQASRDVTRNYQQALGTTDANFARSGGFGGSAWQNVSNNNATALAQGLGDVAGNLRYQNYNDERNRQTGALSTALQYGNQAYTDASQLQAVGDRQYGYDQQLLDDKQALFNERAQSPYKQLDVLGNTIQAAVGGGSSISQTAPGNNPWAQALGGGAALAGLLG